MDVNKLLFRPAEEVKNFLYENNIFFRVLQIDDIKFIMTTEYKSDRYNLFIKEGKVIKITNC